MFGKKKGGDEPVKKTKNRKSSGGQSRFGGGGIKMVFAKHIEKKLSNKLDLTQSQTKALSNATSTLSNSKQSLRNSRMMNFTEIVALLESNQMDQEKAMSLVRGKLDAIEQRHAVRRGKQPKIARVGNEIRLHNGDHGHAVTVPSTRSDAP